MTSDRTSCRPVTGLTLIHSDWSSMSALVTGRATVNNYLSNCRPSCKAADEYPDSNIFVCWVIWDLFVPILFNIIKLN